MCCGFLFLAPWVSQIGPFSGSLRKFIDSSLGGSAAASTSLGPPSDSQASSNRESQAGSGVAMPGNSVLLPHVRLSVRNHLPS